MKKAQYKIMACLNSCETLAHLETTYRMINNFRILFGHSEILNDLIYNSEIIRRKLA